jgi:hypothetical protein
MPTVDEIQTFSATIREASVKKRISLWEALTDHCDETGIEYPVVASLIDKTLKEELRTEVQDLNLLKTRGGKSHKLPL